MRRTNAPSQKKHFISPLLANSSNNTAANVVDKYRFLNKQRNVKEVEVLKNKSDNIQCSLSPGTSELERSLVMKFNAVYGKQSKKKHKTWEGDGIVEVSGKSITLKDSDGKVIGQSTVRKMEEMVEGSRLFVGSKEVELLDLIKDSDGITKRLSSDQHIEMNAEVNMKFKRIKSCSSSTLVDTSTPSGCLASNDTTTRINQIHKRFITPSLNCDVQPLIMPRPSEEHQWQYNTDHMPVVEVEVERWLARVLRQHQREGVSFLFRCVNGMASPHHNGAILADEMGLGKTVQCITLLWTLLKQGFYGGRPVVKRALVVVPSSLVKNWHNEFIRWIGSYRIQIYVVDKNNKIQNYSKSPFVPVVIISYEMFVKNHSCLKDIEFDLIICDEGHRLKNSNIQTTALLSQLPCLRRVLLTGTPIQNDLQEFFTLVNFVNPGILGSYPEFKCNYEKVIVASREPKASEEVIATGEEKSRELMAITANFILRRTQSVIGAYLPPKYEHVVFTTMSLPQKRLYQHLIDYCVQKCDDLISGCETFDHLSAIMCLRKICNHPSLVTNQYFEPSLFSQVQSSCESGDGFISSSNKLKIIETLLENAKRTNEKIVLVSNYTQTLDVLEKFCKLKSVKHTRLDGSTPSITRSSIVSNFNSPHSDLGVLLLSSKAGGVGLNLIGASRLVLYDSDWNPATDLQAMARIWRDGQRKNVFIYRLITTGTIEEKIFQRQLKKTGLSESVIDPTAVSSVKLSKEDLLDLFEYNDVVDGCLTHDSLSCKCDGSGSVPGLPSASNQDELLDEFNDEWDLDGTLKDERENCSPVESVVTAERIEENASQEEADVRDCELSFTMNKSEQVKPKALRMNQLYLWEHHSAPLSSHVLEESGLNESVQDIIGYLFRNKSI